MIVLAQDKLKIHDTNDFTFYDWKDDMGGKVYSISHLGTYKSISRCVEIMLDIWECSKRGDTHYEMPQQ